CGMLRYDLEGDALVIRVSRQYCPDPAYMPLKDEDIPFKSFALIKGTTLLQGDADLLRIDDTQALAQQARQYFTKYMPDIDNYIDDLEAMFHKYSVKSNLAVDIHCQGRPYGILGLH